MEKHFSLKFIAYEVKRNIKLIIVGALIITTAFTMYSFFNVKKIAEAQTFGAYGELFIINDPISQNIDNSNSGATRINDISSLTMPLITSDKLFDAVVGNEKAQELGIEKEELKNMLYVIPKNSGHVIKVSVVADDAQTADVICSIVMEEAFSMYENNGYDIYVKCDTTSMGAVTVVEKDDTSAPGEKIGIISSTSEVTMSYLDLIKKMMVGFILGLVAMMALVLVLFIFKDKVVYSEQIIDNTDVNVLASGTDKRELSRLYSCLASQKDEAYVINFISMERETENYPALFLSYLNNLGEEAVLVRLGEGDCDDSAMTEDERGNHIKVGEKMLRDSDYMKTFIDDLRSKNKYVLFISENVRENPISRIIYKHVDVNIILVKSNTITLEEIKSVAHDVDSIGKNLFGCVML